MLLNMGNSRKIYVFDLDNTLTTYDSFKIFLIYLLFKRPSKIFSYIMVFINSINVRENNSTFKKNVVRFILHDLEKKEINKISSDFAKIIHNHFLNYKLKTLIDSINPKDDILLISASFDFYVNEIGYLLGMKKENIISTKTFWDSENMFIVKSDVINCFGKEKVNRFLDWMNVNNIKSKPFIIFYSDHERDLPFFEYSDEKIMVNPTKRLFKFGIKRGYKLY